MSKKAQPSQLYSYFLALRKHLIHWELIPSTPSDEFDELARKLVNQLTQNAEHPLIYQIIEQELSISFGMTLDSNVVEELADDIMHWWEGRNF